MSYTTLKEKVKMGISPLKKRKIKYKKLRLKMRFLLFPG